MTQPTVNSMTKQEREALAKLIRQRERLAKTAAAERSAQLLADFEQQADRHYHYNEDEVWRRVMATAKEAVGRAQEEIAALADAAAEARRQGMEEAIEAVLRHGEKLLAEWRAGGKRDQHLEGRADADDEYAAAIRAALAGKDAGGD